MISRALFFCLVLLSGCATNLQSTTITHSDISTITYSDIYSPSWTLARIESSSAKIIPQNPHFTLTIDKDKISGKAFNSFSAPAHFTINTPKPNKVSISDKMMTTRMLPPPSARKLEKKYFSLLMHADTWSINNGQLYIFGREGTLIFK